jgi:pimeloyl-ACP methyl ester carboxylesterase
MSAIRTLEVDGTAVRIEGRGRDTVLMIHGWPDSVVLWDGLVAALSSRRRCARFTLPGYAPGAARRAPPLEAMVAHLAAIADAASPDAPITLVVHDWGAFYGYQYAMRHPGRVARIVGLDVGDAGSPAHRRSLPARARAMIAGYQLALAAAWAMPAPIGDAVTRRMARWLRAPASPAVVHARMNYPYAHAWTGRFGGALPVEPRCPMLYVYGERKPFMFHSPEWAGRIAGMPGCAVRGLRAGHWLMRDRAAELEGLVAGWLDGAEGCGLVAARVDARIAAGPTVARRAR